MSNPMWTTEAPTAPCVRWIRKGDSKGMAVVEEDSGPDGKYLTVCSVMLDGARCGCLMTAMIASEWEWGPHIDIP